jgi:translation initiation factor IF-2
MLNDRGERIKSAGPSDPVEILGLSGLPEAGDTVVVAPDEKSAREMVEARERDRRSQRGRGARVTLEEVHTRIASGDVKGLNLIVKTDVQGSVDAVLSVLGRLNTEQMRVNMVHAASGTITESDVLLAVASDAIVVGFNTRPEPGARTLANQEAVDIRLYDIIYNLADDLEMALQGLLEPVTKDVVEGHATVRATFKVGRNAVAAGIYVNDGQLSRGTEIHVLRNGERLFAGSIASLRHFKDDVREMRAGFEGGIVLEGFQAYQEGDILEAHRTVQA